MLVRLARVQPPVLLLRAINRGDEVTILLFRLAALLGTTPDELRDRLSSSDLLKWMAYMESSKR